MPSVAANARASEKPPVHCPACRDGVGTQKAAYIYARLYLCVFHLSLWDAADDHAHTADGTCPHAPATCPRRHCERRAVS